MMAATEHRLVGLVRELLATHPEVAPEPVCQRPEADLAWDGNRARACNLVRGTETERRNAWPYHLAGYVASVELGLGPTAAAKLIGRDRKTLYHGVPRIEDRRDDPEFDAFIEELAALARAGLSDAAIDDYADAESAPQHQRRRLGLRFGSVCSGIEAASAAWESLGWRAAWLAEIEAFPAAVLAHHFPETPNLGDMTAIASAVLAGKVEAPDILVGGTPCQAFSVAGLRRGLSDDRGALSLAYVETLNAIDSARSIHGERPAVAIWENVPGVLSSPDNAFGCFLGALAGEECELQPPGRRWTDAGVVHGPQRAIAWRVLDGQHFGLAQRRRRVFVVASARTGFDPASVLFERDGLRQDSPPCRRGGQTHAGPPAPSTGVLDFLDSRVGYGWDEGAEDFVVPILDGAKGRTDKRGSRDGAALGKPGDPMFTLRGGSSHAIAFALRGRDDGAMPEVNGAGDLVSTLRAADGGSSRDYVATSLGVRRLMPVECERLQGFPDGYTDVVWRGKPAPDGLRYQALGNSMAVPCMAWIGARIAAVLL